MDFDKIEEEILASPAIRLEKTKRKRKETPQDFLINFLSDYNHNRDTIYVDSKPRKIQTKKNKRRSFSDIYRIFKYYYPDVTFKEFARLLYVELPLNWNRFRTSYCHTINKRVFYYDGRQRGIFNKGREDEYGHTFYNWITYVTNDES